MEKSEFDEPESDFDVPADAVGDIETVLGKAVIPIAKRKAQMDAQYRALAADTRALSHRQRVYIRALIANHMRPGLALKATNLAVGGKLDRSSTAKWMKNLSFKSVVDRYTQLALEQAGVASPAQVLLRIDGLVEDALVPEPIVGRNGEVVGYSADRGTAMKGLELLGKANGAFRKDEEASQRVTVVLDFSGDSVQGEQESEVIDGEATEVVR